MENFSIRRAEKQDLKALYEIVQLGYRGGCEEKGWTGEEEIISGVRIEWEPFQTQIDPPNHYFLLEVINEDGTGSIRGGIIVNKISDTTAELGTFSVHPKYQSKGYGKRLLSFAESYARDELGCSVFQMQVISIREELLRWYLKAGYTKTDEYSPFPIGAGLGDPKIPLEFVTIRKPAIK